MVKRRKVLQDGGASTATRPDFLTGPRTKPFKEKFRSKNFKALRKMLMPRGPGPVSPEELGGPEAKDGGSVTPGSFENADGSKEFLSTGRTGRRNALPDILGRHAETGLSDLPERFEELSTQGYPGVITEQANKSGQDPNMPSTSKQQG